MIKMDVVNKSVLYHGNLHELFFCFEKFVWIWSVQSGPNFMKCKINAYQIQKGLAEVSYQLKDHNMIVVCDWFLANFCSATHHFLVTAFWKKLISKCIAFIVLIAQLVHIEPKHVNPEVAASNPALVKFFSVQPQIIDNLPSQLLAFFFCFNFQEFHKFHIEFFIRC